MNSVLVAVLMLAVVSAAIAVPISRAEGTPEVDLADAPDAFMPGAGIAAALIGKANVDLAIMGDPTLRLERVDLPVGSTLPTHTSTVSEILYVETGSVAIADGFGFTTQTQAGQQLIFNPGTAYDLQQAGDEAARVLRVRVAAINEPLLDNANAGQEIGESGATPIIAEPTIITIIDHRLTDAPSPNATYYLARVALTPGAETGEQSHDGALGIYVASGALTALSPSGATGTLNTGASAVLPANVPLIGSNQGADDAVVFLVGLGTQGDPLIVEITPTPVPTIPPTPTATATPEPTATATPEPTPTVPPTATPMPSPTPLPTSIPTPPPPPLTQPDSILQIGETWHTEAADLQVAVTGVGDTLRLTFTYSNISNSRLDFVVPATVISIVDDTQSTWKVDTAATSTINLDEGRRVILDPGDSLEWRVIATVSGTPVQSHVANVFITIHDFGDVAVSRWGFTLYEGKTLSLPPDATNPLGNEDLIISTVTSESDSSISTQNQIPDELAGTWRGMISQKNPDAGWTITITLDSGDIGQVVGSYQSSSHECGGDLILTKRFKSSVELSISTDSSHASCWTVGKLALTAEPTGKLTLSWDGRSSTGDWTTAAATLVRID